MTISLGTQDWGPWIAVAAAVAWSVGVAGVELGLLTDAARRIRHERPPYEAELEKRHPVISPHLQRQQRDLQDILKMLADEPALENLLAATLQRRRQTSRWCQFAISSAVNSLSIVAGWLLSGLVSPADILGLIHGAR